MLLKKAVVRKNRTTLHTRTTIGDIIDMSNKQNINLSVISLDFLSKNLDLETNSFTWLKLHSPTSNLKLKIVSFLTPSPLCEQFARGVHSQHCYTLLRLRYLLISLIRIKGIQIGDHQIKILNFADDTTIFLKDITCLNRIQVILKQYEDASTSKINFLKIKPYRLEHTKIELINQNKWNGHNFL